MTNAGAVYLSLSGISSAISLGGCSVKVTASGINRRSILFEVVSYSMPSHSCDLTTFMFFQIKFHNYL